MIATPDHKFLQRLDSIQEEWGEGDRERDGGLRACLTTEINLDCGSEIHALFLLIC